MLHMLSSFSNLVWQILPCCQVCVEPVFPERPLRGDFRAILLAKSLPYTEERPSGLLAALTVTECKTQKSGLGHFFDTQRTCFV